MGGFGWGVFVGFWDFAWFVGAVLGFEFCWGLLFDICGFGVCGWLRVLVFCGWVGWFLDFGFWIGGCNWF